MSSREMTAKGKKDKRNREKESGNWKPGKWTPEHIARTLLHVRKYACDGLEDLLGPHEGRILAAQLGAEYKSQKSAAMLLAMGVPTIGNPTCEGR